MLPWLLAATLVNSADAASTQWVLSRGGIELNPIVGRHPGPVAIWTLTGSVTTGEWVVAKQWQQTHPRLAKTLIITLTAAKGAAAAHNIYEATHSGMRK
jgi:hypothetical protein